MWLKALGRGSMKVFQFEVIRSFESEAEPFGFPFLPPQDVFGKASGTGTHIGKVKQFVAINERTLKKTDITSVCHAI